MKPIRMARYVDAYSLSDKVFESKKNNPHSVDIVKRNHNCEHERFLKLIANEPTADVVEVVRCKDCKDYRQNPYSPEEDMMCMCWCDWLPTDPDDFCSYGERKEGVEE